MRIRPTELGLKGILLLVALGVAFLAAAYSNLFFLIIVFCCVLGTFGLWWTLRNPRNVVVRLLEAPQAPADSERPLLLVVAETSGRAAFDLAFEVDVAGKRSELAHVPVLRGEARLAASLPAQGRGVQTIGAVRCSSRFPFGLFRLTRTLPVDVELVTFPNPLGRSAAGSASQSGLDDGATAGRSVSVAHLRPFRTGDSQADVHWKATARRGEPIVKEREPGGDAVVEIVLDRRCGDDEQAFELALSRATASLLRAIDASRPVHLRSQGHAVTIDGGRPGDPLLRWLASATPLPLDAPPPARIGEAVLA